MKVFEKFNKEYKAVIAILISAVTTLVANFLEGKLKDKAIAASLTSIILGLISYFFGNSIEKIFENKRSLRKKFLGDDYIEGYYYDESTDTSHVSLISIKLQDDGYLIEGQNYDKSKENFLIGWRSIVSVYKDRFLYTNYKQTGSKSSNKQHEYGILNIEFFGSPTDNYTGYYQDYESTIKHHVSGRKVSESDMKKYKNFEEIAEKKKFICDMLASSVEK